MQLSFQHLSKFFRGFTLIELLVVLAIVGILMSLLFPAVNGALNAARKASAQNDVVQIANALTMYQTEYGQWPPSASGSAQDVGGTLLTSALMAQTTNENRRKIVFLEVQDAKRNRSGFTNDTYVDPWGGVYLTIIDTGYSNQITVPANANSVATSATTLRKGVAVWNTNTNQRLRVGSW
jgi:type II secretion system protein G